MSLLIDPVVLAIPVDARDRSVLENYVSQLLQWSELLLSGEADFYISDQCNDALQKENVYPFFERLKEFWELLGELALSCQDFFTACIKILSHMPFLEDLLELDEYAVDESTVSVRPDLLARLPGSVSETFKHTLGLVACARHDPRDSVADSIQLVTYPLEDSDIAQIDASALSESGTDIQPLATELPLVTTVESYYASQNLAAIWEDVPAGIRSTQESMILAGRLSPQAALTPYHVHSDFVTSIKSRNLDRRSDLLTQIFEKCTLMLAGELPVDGSKHKPLYRPKQVTSGSWKAWRLRITGPPLSLRLHYWRSGSNIQLVQVKPHEDYDIAAPE